MPAPCGAGSQTNKTAYATYFKNTTVGTEDLHLLNDSLSLWGSNGVNLSADVNLAVTDDIDGEPPRAARRRRRRVRRVLQPRHHGGGG